MMKNDGAGGLFRPELVFVAKFDADFLGAEEGEELVLIGDVRAGGVAEGIT